jgi:AraC-like DNA-binding protein
MGGAPTPERMGIEQAARSITSSMGVRYSQQIGIEQRMDPLDFKHPQSDGRLQRSERTRQALIEAYLDLLRENPRIPTAGEIAKRAGCSIRSVFERFSDLLTLSLAALTMPPRRPWRSLRSQMWMPTCTVQSLAVVASGKT